ncbi:hypothetical protein Tco_0751357 [Tanacetum coccineum]|uniref:Uncharacterized protein n=1 Tax=Tanacetum coccineum TaxID=301880 RepID=A0ABQ4Z503_9ASTR
MVAKMFYSVFGPDDTQYPKRVVSESGANLGVDLRRQNGPSHMRNVAAQNDGFQVVQNHKHKGKLTTTFAIFPIDKSGVSRETCRWG